MRIQRREFLKSAAALAASSGLPAGLGAAPATGARSYPYLGRTDDYAEFRVIEPGRTLTKVESWTRGSYGVVRLTTNDGHEGWGQLSSFEPDITATVLHRQVARHVLGSDPAQIDALVDRVIDANMKFPWSYVCRALAGVDTALWDLYGQLKGQPVCVLLGGKTDPFPVYGSSMRRDISPEDEAARLAKLRDERGFQAFKVRLGTPTGHDRDAAPGRTEKLIPAVRKALGDGVRLLADANSCYSPPKAVAVGRRLEDHGYFFFEEPCPYWELEWTAEVAAALRMHVAGGEQDNDLAQWRRMIRLNAVDVLQPDLCYVGGFTRAWRVARLGQQAGKIVVPHSSHLSLITVFSLHFMAALPNAGPFVEFTIEGDGNKDEEFYRPALEVRDGKVKLPDGPGWGVKINPAWLEKASYQKSEAAASR
jgi:L-alanine-DL-glutamate epimerase-like enolase superfamily enzyme